MTAEGQVFWVVDRQWDRVAGTGWCWKDDRAKRRSCWVGAHALGRIWDRRTVFKNGTIGGRPAPVRGYIEELLPDVLEGKIEPGRVIGRPSGSTECPTVTGP